jgi:hypothetical protein
MTDFNLLLNNASIINNPQVIPTVVENTLGVWEAFVTMFAFFIVVIAVHELGHFFMLTRYNPEAKIYVSRKGWAFDICTGENEDYWVLTPQQRFNVYIAGVIAGLVPIFLFATLHEFYVLLLAPYVLGLWPDAQNIYRSILQTKRLNDKNKTAVKTV